MNHLAGKKTERAFKFFLGQLQKIHDDPRGGVSALKKQFEKAEETFETSSKAWQSITHSNWTEKSKGQRLASNGRPEISRPRTQHLPELTPDSFR